MLPFKKREIAFVNAIYPFVEIFNVVYLFKVD